MVPNQIEVIQFQKFLISGLLLLIQHNTNPVSANFFQSNIGVPFKCKFFHIIDLDNKCDQCRLTSLEIVECGCGDNDGGVDT
ncbi:hypothetical protein DERP_003506 [Dermatophagoides pteronyssinus]|uniref:Uncharacterized protein n=1 Tax=Dermatophagoides pteronyssinus TaxID=6956 RepID=A0ABQ8JLD0_DERPT|nr:hypothetical protein DERP_003506 [Dermatophagoides pteronyssinus]